MLFLCLDLLGLLGSLDREVDDLAAIIPSAVRAHGMAAVGRLAILALRNARARKGVVRPPIVAVGPRCAHSIYHGKHYYIG